MFGCLIEHGLALDAVEFILGINLYQNDTRDSRSRFRTIPSVPWKIASVPALIPAVS